MDWLALGIGLVTGVLSGCGIGGGSLLVLWLTSAESISQAQAGGMNLLYFICCAPAALYGHMKNKLIVPQAVLWGAVAGAPISVVAALFALHMDVSLLRRMFGFLLLYIGGKELLCKKPEAKREKGK